MQPISVSRLTSGSRGKECLLNAPGHWSTPARSNWYTINFTNWRNLSRRARKECFVSAQEIVQAQRSGFHSVAQVAADLHHHLASDAEKNRVTFVIGQQLPITHDKKILTRSFGEVTVLS